MYGLAILWTIIAIVIWEKWRQNPTGKLLVGWILVMTLMVYTHYFGLLMLAAFLLLNWLLGPRRRVFTIAACVPGLAFLPWVAFVLPVYESRGLDSNLWWVHMLLPRSHEAMALMLADYLGEIPGPRTLRVGLAVTATLLHLVLFVFAWRSIRRVWPPRPDADSRARWFWVMAVLAGVPVVLLYLFSVVYTPAFAARFLLGITPAYWLLLVMMSEFGGRGGSRLIYGPVLVWVLASIGVALVIALQSSPIVDRTRTLAAELRPTDLVISERLHSNGLYWEIAHRQGRPVRFLVFDADRHEKPSSGPEQRGEEQGERLSIFRYSDFGRVDLSGVERVWLIHKSKDAAAYEASLASRGWKMERQLGDATPYLSLFVKRPT
jgi:hypothetical protein